MTVNGTTSGSTLGRRASLCVAVGVALLLSVTLTPQVAGMFHDDGIYTAVAKSVAERQGYRLQNLPGEPYQTKYPPVYSTIVAAAWRINPDFPSNVFLLKTLNLGFIAAALVAMAVLARAQSARGGDLIPIASQIALGTNPMLVSFANYLMSDVLFTALVVIVLAIWMRYGHSSDFRRELLTLSLVSMAILTRSVGISLAAAIVLDCVWRGERRRALLHATVGMLVFGTWMAWGTAHRAHGSTLVDYYQNYERPAVAHLLTEPLLTFHIVWGNLRFAVDSMPWTIGPVWILGWPLIVVLLAVGGWRLARSGGRVTVLFAACYTPLVLLHPFVPYRYLLPVTPVMILAVIVGSHYLWAKAGRFFRKDAIPEKASALILTIVLIGNVSWIQYRLRAGDEVRGWAGTDMGYSWSGFEETFDWIRVNTPRDARLGSIFDPMYFLYTGRQGVRPWFHRPETYFYPYNAAKPAAGHPEDVARELHALGIGYLILDPPTGYAEGPAAISMLRRLISLPHVNARLVFTSSDSNHEVYRLWGPSEVLEASGK